MSKVSSSGGHEEKAGNPTTGDPVDPIERKAHSARKSELFAPIADESSNVKKTSPKNLRRLSRRLLEHQYGRDPYVGEFVQRFERNCHSLHDELASRVGSLSSRSLFWRALQISKAEFPYLDQITHEAALRCSFDVLREPLREGAPPVEEALAVVLANLIWLYINIIGYRFTFHVLHQVWPHVSIEELRSFQEA